MVDIATALLQLFHQWMVFQKPFILLEKKDMMAVNIVYQNLMITFLDDVEKYASNKSMSHIIRHVIQYAPLQARNRIKFQDDFMLGKFSIPLRRIS